MSKRKITDRHHRHSENNKIILINYEGITENNYFSYFNVKNKKYRIKYAFGNQTDPVNIVKNLYNTIIRNYGNDFFDNNCAYCIFDIDTYKNKEEIINEALSLCNKYGIIPITSAPCIELWYLLHFEDCNGYITSNNTVKRLKKYIPNYTKGLNIGDKLLIGINDAIARAKRLEKTNISNGYKIGSVDTNPNTEVYKIVEYIMSLDDNN